MAKLNEYLGSIVSSITNARVMSDIQTVKVAEEYSKHKLLKHFPIPRMRIDDVELTIPIALEDIQENIVRVLEPIDNKKFNALAYREIANGLGLRKLPREMSLEIQRQIAKSTSSLEQKLRIANTLEPLNAVYNEVITSSLETARKNKLVEKEILTKITPATIQANLENILSREIKFTEQREAFDHLNVIVEAQKLREQSPGTIIYVKMKISENGMEWNRIENSNGELEEKLLPE